MSLPGNDLHEKRQKRVSRCPGMYLPSVLPLRSLRNAEAVEVNLLIFNRLHKYLPELFLVDFSTNI